MPGPHEEAMPADPWPGGGGRQSRPKPFLSNFPSAAASSAQSCSCSRGCSGLAHPEPLPEGCGSAPNPAPASIPRGTARSQPGAGCALLLPGSCRGAKGPGSSPSLPVPVRLPRRQFPVPRLVQAAFPRSRGPGAVPSWVPARPFLTMGIYRKAAALPKRAQPSPDAELAAALETTSLLCSQTHARRGHQHRCCGCQPGRAAPGAGTLALPVALLSDGETPPTFACSDTSRCRNSRGAWGQLVLEVDPASQKGGAATSAPGFPGNADRAKAACPGRESPEVSTFGGNKSEQTKLSGGERGGTFSALIIIPERFPCEWGRDFTGGIGALLRQRNTAISVL